MSSRNFFRQSSLLPAYCPKQGLQVLCQPTELLSFTLLLRTSFFLKLHLKVSGYYFPGGGSQPLPPLSSPLFFLYFFFFFFLFAFSSQLSFQAPLCLLPKDAYRFYFEPLFFHGLQGFYFLHILCHLCSMTSNLQFSISKSQTFISN